VSSGRPVSVGPPETPPEPSRSEVIPFNRPSVGALERRYVLEALEQAYLQGSGPFTDRCQRLLESDLGCARALLTPSGSHALDMMALLLEVGPGDEVVVPAFTFVSTANAFLVRGARPVFADVRPDTLNLDERTFGSLLTRRTRAIVPVHYGGIACGMDAILEVAGRAGVPVVEDNAHGLYGAYRGRPLGTFGPLAAQSFHATKNLTAGEGGAVIVNDAALAERAEIVWEKGTNRHRFLRGEIARYTWVDIGSSFLMSELQAALLWAQLERRDELQAARGRIWRAYAERLAPWASRRGVALPAVPTHCTPAWHLFYLLVPTADRRDAFIESLAAAGIQAASHYVPLHTSPMGRRLGYASGDCPVAEDVSARLVRLPLFADLSEAGIDRVCQAVMAAPL